MSKPRTRYMSMLGIWALGTHVLNEVCVVTPTLWLQILEAELICKLSAGHRHYYSLTFAISDALCWSMDTLCNKRMKSYFCHTCPSLQPLVPTLSPLLVHFLHVYLLSDSSRLLVATAACKHQSRLTQSSSKRSYNITDLRMKPPTMPDGNDSCTQARFAVTHGRVRSSSGSFFPRLVPCVLD